MKNFGIKYNGRAVVVLDGNHVVGSYVRSLPCFRKCLSLAKKSSNYVELWYQNGDGSCVLVDYWN